MEEAVELRVSLDSFEAAAILACHPVKLGFRRLVVAHERWCADSERQVLASDDLVDVAVTEFCANDLAENPVFDRRVLNLSHESSLNLLTDLLVMLFVHFSDFFLRDLHDFLGFLLGNLFFALGLCFLK